MSTSNEDKPTCYGEMDIHGAGVCHWKYDNGKTYGCQYERECFVESYKRKLEDEYER